ncbi:MAG: hypothetical protein WKF70_04595 [Chitinophagaceae bacterium]
MKWKHVFPFILMKLPRIYATLPWAQIEAIVPLHHNWKGEPDRPGLKQNFKIIIGLNGLKCSSLFTAEQCR